MGEYAFLGIRVVIGGSDYLWLHKCTRCGHKKYSMFKSLQDTKHSCVEKEIANEFGTQNKLSRTEVDSDAEGDF